ncbi:hypothetical protein PMI23_03963, partial [Pseudomonas sp. GM24]
MPVLPAEIPDVHSNQGFAITVGVSLLAIAFCQTMLHQMPHRYREQ